MKHLKAACILLTILLFTTKSSAQKTILPALLHTTTGIGLLHVSIDAPVYFYTDKNARAPFDTLTFERKADGNCSFKSGMLQQRMKAYQQYEGNPKIMGIEAIQPILIFKVLAKTPEGFTIMLNEDLHETAFIKNKERTVYSWQGYYAAYGSHNSDIPPVFIYETWADYLTRVANIKATGSLKIYDKPNGKILVQQESDLDMLPFKVTEVNGNWAKVTAATGYITAFIPGKTYEGWMQWSDGKELLITITEDKPE